MAAVAKGEVTAVSLFLWAKQKNQNVATERRHHIL